MYPFFDRGLIVNPPLGPCYLVTYIMSQRSHFNQVLGNIFYEAIRLFFDRGLDEIDKLKIKVEVEELKVGD